jgi:hypothetical protein
MSSLVKLARLVGIQDAIPTRDGREQPVLDETRRSLLKSNGINAEYEEGEFLTVAMTDSIA